jgi:hypothetical protein
MKDVTRYTAFLIALFSLCFSCREDCCQDCVDSKCRFANIITAQSGCYDSEQGLVLTATGNAPDLSYQTWTVYVLKDTTDGWTPADIKITEYRNGNITIPDSILLDNQQVFAQLFTWCNGTDYHSMGYHFFKMTSNNCTTWIRQEKPPHLYYCFGSAELLDARRHQHEDNNMELQYGFQKKSRLYSDTQARYSGYCRM